MDKFKPLAKIKNKIGIKKSFLNLILGAGNISEILLIIFIWYIIFNNKKIFAGFTMEEIFSYLLLGGIIGMLSGYFLYKIIKRDVRGDRQALLARRPIGYLAHLLKKNISKILIPFLIYSILNLLLLHFFVGSLALSLDSLKIAVFLAMIIMAFLIEFLIAYLINLHIFWTIESENLYLFLIRLKKIMAGAFFPLIVLPETAYALFLALPFAYSFYVPTQFLLSEISTPAAIHGLFVQLAWIILLYIFVRYSYQKNKAGS